MKDVINGLYKNKQMKKNPEFSLLLNGRETSSHFFVKNISLEITNILKTFLDEFDMYVNLFRG